VNGILTTAIENPGKRSSICGVPVANRGHNYSWKEYFGAAIGAFHQRPYLSDLGFGNSIPTYNVLENTLWCRITSLTASAFAAI
jgi:hypothetical protein